MMSHKSYYRRADRLFQYLKYALMFMGYVTVRVSMPLSVCTWFRFSSCTRFFLESPLSAGELLLVGKASFEALLAHIQPQKNLCRIPIYALYNPFTSLIPLWLSSALLRW